VKRISATSGQCSEQLCNRLLRAQRRWFFPLPGYDLSQPERVMVTLRGRILDVR
jgi:hypothetical protein